MTKDGIDTMAQQIATIVDHATTATGSQSPSTDSLDLTTLPERLDDEMLARVTAIAEAPLAPLPTCDSQTFAQALRMMLAVLPKRQSDEVSGELFVAAYQRALGGYPKPAIQHLCDRAIETCRWFPTVAECLEILSTWRRTDEAVLRKVKAERLARDERAARSRRPWGPTSAFRVTQAEIDAMSPQMIELGLSCGALVERDGNVIPAPEA